MQIRIQDSQMIAYPCRSGSTTLLFFLHSICLQTQLSSQLVNAGCICYAARRKDERQIRKALWVIVDGGLGGLER
jgi:hypothetical protein